MYQTTVRERELTWKETRGTLWLEMEIPRSPRWKKKITKSGQGSVVHQQAASDRTENTPASGDCTQYNEAKPELVTGGNNSKTSQH